MARLANIERRTVRIDELEATVLIAVVQIVLGVTVLTGEFARLIAILLFFAIGRPIIDEIWLAIVFCEIKGGCHLLDELFRKAAVANESFLGMQILVESLTDNAVGVDRDAYLLKHSIHVGVQLVLTTLSHEDHTSTAFLNITTDVLQLLRGEWQTRSTK